MRSAFWARLWQSLHTKLALYTGYQGLVINVDRDHIVITWDDDISDLAKFLKWGMFKGTLEPQRLYIFNPRLLKTQTSIAMNNFKITFVHISLLLKIRWQIIRVSIFFTKHKSTFRALEVNIKKTINTVRRL